MGEAITKHTVWVDTAATLLPSLSSPQKYTICWQGQRRCTSPLDCTQLPRSEGRGSGDPSSPCKRQQGLLPISTNQQHGFHTAGTQPAFADGHRAAFSIQETVETTKTLLRLIQLMSLHPIKRVIFSSCSVQEPHSRPCCITSPSWGAACGWAVVLQKSLLPPRGTSERGVCRRGNTWENCKWASGQRYLCAS